MRNALISKQNKIFGSCLIGNFKARNQIVSKFYVFYWLRANPTKSVTDIDYMLKKKHVLFCKPYRKKFNSFRDTAVVEILYVTVERSC